MLGALAKYIFGGMMGDAPETTAPELQYHTREVNDWLLVDMPDQAIDDEDLDSESDDDDILTALPLLMAEEIVQPVQKVQSGEEMKDYSVCDNSYDKVQRCDVDKIRSVPSVVQHHSRDKNQGVVLENIKELKSVQQAIQQENRKYLTRSQLNRQNRNYMYQSSTKANRRRNLQRNHSGANNNRKC